MSKKNKYFVDLNNMTQLSMKENGYSEEQAWFDACFTNYLEGMKSLMGLESKPTSLPAVLGFLLQGIGRILFAITVAFWGSFLAILFYDKSFPPATLFTVAGITLAIVFHVISTSVKNTGKVFTVICAALAPVSLAGLIRGIQLFTAMPDPDDVLYPIKHLNGIFIIIWGAIDSFRFNGSESGAIIIPTGFYVACLIALVLSIVCAITFVNSRFYASRRKKWNKQTIKSDKLLIQMQLFQSVYYDDPFLAQLCTDLDNQEKMYYGGKIPLNVKVGLNKSIARKGLLNIAKKRLEQYKQYSLYDNLVFVELFDNKL